MGAPRAREEAVWRTTSGRWCTPSGARSTMTRPALLRKMAAAGFRFDRMSDAAVAEGSAGGPAATLAAFRAAERSTSAPPGPATSWLGETLVHAEDIRRPLG